jgi:TPP-dependent pyruvate/acetoin dehydrogenase alpha subunit
MNFAGVFKTPCILLCRNNGYAISTSSLRQTASETIAVKARAYGLPGVRVDGNDVFAVIKATREAADRARAGEGATLIEAVTYRQGAHSSSDDPRAYRPDDEVEKNLQRDPIVRLRRYLESRKLWDAAREEALQEQVKQEILDAVAHAEKFGAPPVESLFDDVFAELTPALREQKESLLDYRKRNPQSSEVK